MMVVLALSCHPPRMRSALSQRLIHLPLPMGRSTVPASTKTCLRMKFAGP